MAVMTGIGGTATWRVTLTGAARHVPVSQSAADDDGPDGAVAGDAADEAALVADAGLAAGVSAGLAAGVLVVHDATATSTMARKADRTSGSGVAMRRIMTSCRA